MGSTQIGSLLSSVKRRPRGSVAVLLLTVGLSCGPPPDASDAGTTNHDAGVGNPAVDAGVDAGMAGACGCSAASGCWGPVQISGDPPGITACSGTTVCALNGQCVIPQYEDLGTTVTDQVTGLVWQKDVPMDPCGMAEGLWTCDWAGVQAYCNTLSLPGSGWRVPTLAEDFSIASMSGNTLSDPPELPYWSSTPYGDAGYHFLFNYGYEDEDYDGDTGGGAAVRCVR